MLRRLSASRRRQITLGESRERYRMKRLTLFGEDLYDVCFENYGTVPYFKTFARDEGSLPDLGDELEAFEIQKVTSSSADQMAQSPCDVLDSRATTPGSRLQTTILGLLLEKHMTKMIHSILILTARQADYSPRGLTLLLCQTSRIY